MTRTATSILLGAEAPRVLTVPMIAAALAHQRKPAARGTLFGWIRAQTASGALRPVTRGLYLNQLARPLPSAAEAAGYVRSGAIVSLQTVLGDAGVTNSYSDIITSVLPIRQGSASSSRPVVADQIEFRFHAMPVRLLDERAGALEDRMDLDVLYARATPEKALLDWLYLGASPRTKLSGPPLDIDLERLDAKRLTRLAKRMTLSLRRAQGLSRPQAQVRQGPRCAREYVCRNAELTRKDTHYRTRCTCGCTFAHPGSSARSLAKSRSDAARAAGDILARRVANFFAIAISLTLLPFLTEG